MDDLNRNDGFERREEYYVQDRTYYEPPRDTFIQGKDETYHVAYIEYEREEEQKSNGFAIASLVLGIVGLVSFCAYQIYLPIVGLILGIISIAQKRAGKGMAVAGIIISSFSLVLSLLSVIIFFVSINQFR